MQMKDYYTVRETAIALKISEASVLLHLKHDEIEPTDSEYSFHETSLWRVPKSSFMKLWRMFYEKNVGPYTEFKIEHRTGYMRLNVENFFTRNRKDVRIVLKLAEKKIATTACVKNCLKS